jgi:hypothetical protein
MTMSNWLASAMYLGVVSWHSLYRTPGHREQGIVRSCQSHQTYISQGLETLEMLLNVDAPLSSYLAIGTDVSKLHDKTVNFLHSLNTWRQPVYVCGVGKGGLSY